MEPCECSHGPFAHNNDDTSECTVRDCWCTAYVPESEGRPHWIDRAGTFPTPWGT